MTIEVANWILVLLSTAALILSLVAGIFADPKHDAKWIRIFCSVLAVWLISCTFALVKLVVG